MLAATGYYIYSKSSLAEKERTVEVHKTIVDVMVYKETINGEEWPKPRRIIDADADKQT